MKKLKKMIAVMTMVSLLTTVSSAFAADDTIREVLTILHTARLPVLLPELHTDWRSQRGLLRRLKTAELK
jgi:hypothetical protein